MKSATRQRTRSTSSLVEYNLQDFQSLTQVLTKLSTELAAGAEALGKALVNGGLGEPHDLDPIHEYKKFVDVWTAELGMVAGDLAMRARLCQTVTNALTAVDTSAADGLSGL